MGVTAALHDYFRKSPCLPPVGNYPLSVMGVLLAPQLIEVLSSIETFGRAMEGIAHEWVHDPEMEDHVKLMGFLAAVVYPLCNIGGQGEVIWTYFLWKSGRDSLIEFMRAATCADELEVLWRRMEEEEEMDPSGSVLEISRQSGTDLNEGIGDAPEKETATDLGTASRAPEVSRRS